MQELFSKLIDVYRKAEGSCHAPTVNYRIDSDDDIALITEITSDQNYDNTHVDVDVKSLVVGTTVQLDIKQPDPNLGRTFKEFKDFIKGDFPRVLSSNNISKTPYYIEDINYFSQDHTTPDIIKAYNSIQKLLSCLANMSAYLDSANRKIIFVGKQTFELHYDVSNDLVDFEKILEDFSQNTGKKLKVIEDFCNWLDVSDVNRHSNERKSILSSVLFDIQAGSEPLGICEVIENVERLYTSAKGQFDNYLEDFKYEKFVQKLEENSEKFIGRVNDSISKVLSQILALPIAAAAPVILKGQGKSSEIVIYLALLVYATICYFALSTQKAVLDHLESEVNNFGKEGMLPKSLGEKWNIEKKKILLLIDKQTHLYWIMRGIICIVIAYSAFKIFDTSF
ncbi:hypothetical protein [Psychrobacter sp. Ps2]|uniref:hypothetical protein n=1 Tax=Psychrobacter sp. Ps2 TaxID=2790956 RepID=UPI001EDDC56B|nr:hypothetical protein [Psychrobacter sp. Ps2]MCG3857977.1 hypothetical protein [Psychrobacter sp. Ps2]